MRQKKHRFRDAIKRLRDGAQKRPLKFGQSFLHPTGMERQYFFGMARIFLCMPALRKQSFWPVDRFAAALPRQTSAAGFGYFALAGLNTPSRASAISPFAGLNAPSRASAISPLQGSIRLRRLRLFRPLQGSIRLRGLRLFRPLQGSIRLRGAAVSPFAGLNAPRPKCAESAGFSDFFGRNAQKIKKSPDISGLCGERRFAVRIDVICRRQPKRRRFRL